MNHFSLITRKKTNNLLGDCGEVGERSDAAGLDIRPADISHGYNSAWWGSCGGGAAIECLIKLALCCKAAAIDRAGNEAVAPVVTCVWLMLAVELLDKSLWGEEQFEWWELCWSVSMSVCCADVEFWLDGLCSSESLLPDNKESTLKLSFLDGEIGGDDAMGDCGDPIFLFCYSVVTYTVWRYYSKNDGLQWKR